MTGGICNGDFRLAAEAGGLIRLDGCTEENDLAGDWQSLSISNQDPDGFR